LLWTRGVAGRETLSYLDRRGIDPEPALIGAGISRCQLSQDNIDLPVAPQYRFLELAAAEANDQLLGLHVAAEMDLRSIGLLFYLAGSLRTVSEALENSFDTPFRYRCNDIRGSSPEPPCHHRRRSVSSASWRPRDIASDIVEVVARGPSRLAVVDSLRGELILFPGIFGLFTTPGRPTRAMTRSVALSARTPRVLMPAIAGDLDLMLIGDLVRGRVLDRGGPAARRSEFAQKSSQPIGNFAADSRGRSVWPGPRSSTRGDGCELGPLDRDDSTYQVSTRAVCFSTKARRRPSSFGGEIIE
jgi:hypothetical protein